MDMMQMDLFAYAAVQAKKEIGTPPQMDKNAPEIDAEHTPVILRNFQNDGRHGMPTTPAARIEANFKAVRLLKELEADIRRRRVPFSTVITRPNISLISCGTSSGRSWESNPARWRSWAPGPEISSGLRRFKMPMSSQPSKSTRFPGTLRKRFIRSQTSGSHCWRPSNCRNSMTS